MIRFWAISLIAVGCLGAHEQPTHVNITKQALQYLATTNARPDILQLYSDLTEGAWNEDAFFPGYPGYLGRFYFHFLPTLNDLGQSATCNSVSWGVFGSSCIASTIVPLIGSTTAINDHTWQNAIAGADSTTAVPNESGWTHLGYVIHLLEDLTSPPHTHNSAHPCVAGFAFCDPFEPLNNGAAVNSPKTEYVDFTGVTGPQDFFTRVQAYTVNYYFSARTVFGETGPTAIFQDANYFYASCLQASIDFGTCLSVGGQAGRRIAYKGLAYRASELFGTPDPTKAEIDTVIAHDQFSELGPVAVQAVADFIKFYAPELTVKATGPGTGQITSTANAIDCPANSCTALFVNGTSVALTAAADSGFRFAGWGIDCTGTSKTTSIVVTQESVCTADFEPRLPAVRLNPFGNQNGTVPYNVQVVDSTLMATPAPQNITITLLREVFSECSGLLFSSNRTVVVSQGQSSATFNFDAGHDPACNTLPITTVYTITDAVLAPSTVLDLSIVPPQQLMLFSIH